MDKQTAIRIIRDTFESPFDKARFVDFIKNLLNKTDETKAFHIQGNYIPESFKDYVRSYERIGTYTDPENKKIDILVVYLQKETSLERARTAQRNFVARYLKERDEKEAGLVAFVSPDSSDWRFSLVKMDYLLEESPSGKTKVRTELTPARRFSFIVGENESSHTAQSQLVPILQDDSHDPTLKQLEAAFNIEKVTKEFFEKYRGLYDSVHEALDALVTTDKRVRDDFTANGLYTVDFCKKLLGQIVFLYFLQKKGWLGVPEDKAWGEGDRRFLRHLFETCNNQHKNFLNDFLEYLFYDALNNQSRGGIDPSYYSRFNCKIPFLNGGLFDPINNYDWERVDIPLPNYLFSNIEKTREGDIGTGILDVFDRYNFTVKEDEPLDKEVAIDPEMLGKVFENLLEVKDRKSKGTYYTPREIVHYMCQESLINYLDTVINTGEVPLVAALPPQGKLFGKPDPEQVTLKALAYRAVVPREDIEAFVRMGELAIEHDARVEGAGRETRDYSYKLPESIRQNASLIDEKLATIRVCDPAIGSGAFPVGMMHEIIKARNVLTTYLPAKADVTRANYHFKRHAIQNCLYGVDIDPGAVEIAKLRLWLSLVVDEEDIKQIQPLPNLDYKIVCGNSLLGFPFKSQRLTAIEQLKQQFFDETNHEKKAKLKSQVDQQLREACAASKRALGYEVNFDFEIYFSEVFHEKGGFDVVIANPPYGANIDSSIELYAKLYTNTTKYYKDIYKIFIERSISTILKKNGVMTYILPNTLLLQPRYRDARQFLLKYKIVEIVNLGEEVFEVGTVPTCIIIVQNRHSHDMVRFADVSNKSKFSGNLDGLQHSITEQQCYEETAQNIFVSELRKPGDEEIPLVEILELKDGGIKYQRINVGLSQKGKNDLAQRLFYEGDRRNEKDYCFFIGKDLNKSGWHIDLSVKRYMKHNYKSILKDNEIVYFNKELFNKDEKIVWRQTSAFFVGTYLKSKMWFANTIQGGYLKEKYQNAFYLKYILALLNSTYLRYLYNLAVRESGRVFPQVKLSKLASLPIRKKSLDAQQPITGLVDQILTITKDEDYLANLAKQAKVKELERHIDQMVYELYGLTPEEIAVVESINKK